MRVSSSQIYDRIKLAFQKNMFEYAKNQEQLFTGKKINKPSDDPISANKIIDYKFNIQNLEQYKKNINESKELLSFIEQNFALVVDNLIRAKELAIQAADDALTVEQKAYLAKEVREISKNILGIANSKFKDIYVFSGFKTDIAPFDENNFNYLGDENISYVSLDRTILMGQNVPGIQVFGSGINSVFNNLKNLADGIESNNKSLINNALGELDIDINKILNFRADFGARLNSLEIIEKRQEEAYFNLSELLSKTEDADLSEVVTKLSKAQLSLQALRQASAPVIQESLLDFLK